MKFNKLYQNIFEKNDTTLDKLKNQFLDYSLNYMYWSDDEYTMSKMEINSPDEGAFEYDTNCTITIPIKSFLKYFPEFDTSVNKKDIKNIESEFLKELPSIIKNIKLPYKITNKKYDILFNLEVEETYGDEILEVSAESCILKKIKVKSKNIILYLDNIEFNDNMLDDEYYDIADEIRQY